MSLKLSRKKVHIILSVVILAIPLGLGFVKYALPSLLVVRYKHQINEAFDSFFTPELQQHVRNLGVTSPRETTAADCDNGPYSSTSPCSKYRGDSFIRVDKKIAAKWEKSGKALDDYLTGRGWQRQTGEGYSVPDQYRTFGTLLNGKGDYQVFASYSRQRHGVFCSMSADFIKGAPSDTVLGVVSVSESCFKTTTSPAEWFRRKTRIEL